MGALLLPGRQAVAIEQPPDENEIQGRGFAPEKLYQLQHIDSINLFSGSLGLSIPLASYPVNGQLSYEFRATYSSAAWTYHFQASGCDHPEPERWIEGVATPTANLGLGWMLSFGYLVPPGHEIMNDDIGGPVWIYVAPDGGQHYLWDVMHAEERPSSQDPDPDPGVWYSRDQTTLRLREDAGGPDVHELDFPNGTIHRFEVGVHDATLWELTEIRDRFGNRMTVDRTAPDPNHWLVSDDHGRQHLIEFEDGCDGLPICDLPRPRIKSVTLEGFGGQPAVYSFTYAVRTIDRGCRDTCIVGNNDDVTVPLLVGITLPSGEQYAFGTQATPDYHISCEGSTGGPTGRPRSVTLPTQGKIAWDWGAFYTPRDREAGGSPGSCVGFTGDAAVIARHLVAPDGTTEGTWSYDNGIDPALPGQCGPGQPEVATETRTVVESPTGECMKHYFAAAPRTSLADSWAFGMPFSPSIQGGSIHLSTETWDGAVDTGITGPAYLQRDCESDPPGGGPLRSTWVAYEHDTLPTHPFFEDGRHRHNTNRRVAQTKTLFHDAAHCGAGTETCETTSLSSDFDAHGHYRETVYDGNLPGSNDRTALTDYNPSLGTYPGTHSHPAPGQPWVLGTFGKTEVTENGATTCVEYCFDEANGFLKRRRVLADRSIDPAQGGNDVLEVFNRDPLGNRDVERSFGGDAPATPVPSGVLCDLTLPSPNTYRAEHEYSNGALARSFYTTTGGAEPGGTSIGFNSHDADVDVSGLAARVRDASTLFGTSLGYDAMGRMTLADADPGEGADTVYLYQNATWDGTTFAPAKVTVTREDGGSVLARAVYEYDPFGRLAREIRSMPDDEEAERTIEYDDAGRRDRVSEWRPLGTPVTGETVFTYDEFGRPETVTAPDGSQTSFAYAGVSQVDRTVTIEMPDPGGPTSVTVRERYDRFGRLHSVEEPSGSGNLWTYGYDEGDRLVAVNASAPGLDPQTRTFDYDGRGFLLEECHPEKGVPAAPVGCVAYDAYDARGHAQRKSEAGRVLDFAYDKAERLLTVADTSAGRALKSFVYDGDDPDPEIHEREDGRLRVATRHNWVDLPWDGTNNAVDVTVTETYAYDGTGGRASTRSTVLARPAPYGTTTFSQAFTWTPLGDPARLTYPTCSGVACPAGEPTLQVDHGYDAGFLTSLTNPSGTDWLTDIQYHPNGLWSGIDRSNGWRDEQSIAGNGMQRPEKIQTLDGSQQVRFTTGTFAYDGAGNVTAMTPDSFDYDAHSRLVAASIDGAPYGFAYDAYGNLSSYSGPTGTVSICIDSEKNRIVELGTPGCDDLKARQDPFGNVTELQGFNYEHDALDMLIHRKPVPPPLKKDQGATVEPERTYVYTADDERIWQIQAGGPLPPPDENDPGGPEYTSAPERITVRDLAGKVLRQYDKQTAAEFDPPDDVYAFPFTGTRDSIHRNGQLAATQTGTWWITHQHLDHLGTPRAISDGSGALVATHKYAPYGKEIGASSGNALQFTGHERDSHGAGEDDNLDYMHARFRSLLTARFLSLDPVMQLKRAMKMPQLWNRYAYGVGNPLKYTDPTGRVVELPANCADKKTTCKELADLRNTVPPELRIFVRPTTTKGGRVVLDARFLNAKSGAASGNFQALRQIANSPGTAVFDSSTTRVGSEVIGANGFTAGMTLSAAQSASGKVEAYVGGDLSAREAAETTAHEIRHVRRYLLGLPSLDEMIQTFTQGAGGLTIDVRLDPAGPVNIETSSAEQEAIRNYDPFIPPSN